MWQNKYTVNLQKRWKSRNSFSQIFQLCLRIQILKKLFFCFTSFFNPSYINSIDSTFSPVSTHRTRRSLIFFIFPKFFGSSFCSWTLYVQSWCLHTKIDPENNSVPHKNSKLYNIKTISGLYRIRAVFCNVSLCTHTTQRQCSSYTTRLDIVQILWISVGKENNVIWYKNWDTFWAGIWLQAVWHRNWVEFYDVLVCLRANYHLVPGWIVAGYISDVHSGVVAILEAQTRKRWCKDETCDGGVGSTTQRAGINEVCKHIKSKSDFYQIV